MLCALHIKNIVLIESLDLQFQAGLTGFTGETGAGKSILLDSLGLALGARADMNLLRKGAENASVTAEFDVSMQHAVKTVFEKNDLEFSGVILLRRTLSSDGKSRAFVNDQPVGITILREIGEHLADIHGQFETYGLLNPSSHLGFLDQFADVGEDLKSVKKSYDEMQQARLEWQNAIQMAQKAKADEEFLTHAVDELKKLNPREGEESELTSIKQNLSQREFILTSLNEIDSIVTNDKGAESYLIKVARLTQKLLDKQLISNGDEAMEHLDAALQHIQSFSSIIESTRAAFEDPDYNIETIDDRLYALRAAARKFQCAVEELPEKLNEFSNALKHLHVADEDIKNKEAIYIKAEREAQTAARQLSHKRIAASQVLDKMVNAELPPLKLAKAKFKTQIDVRELSPSGIDDVSFTVATNAESDFGPLHKVASGGEMARFMLAIKVVLASKNNHQNCYVFDEIDTGIGGATAAAVGERLARMAEHHQVLVVTHSPQVAAAAAEHFNVRKDGMKTDVVKLTDEQRQEEIARMLSGAEISDEARAAARTLLSPKAKSAA